MEYQLKVHHRNQCLLCQKTYSSAELSPVETIRDSLVKAIKKFHPDINLETGYICKNDLNKLRKEYFRQLILEEQGDLTEIEASVVKALHEHEVVSKLLDADDDTQLSFGQKLSDKIAEFGGSWTFIILFATILSVWIIWNNHSDSRFDPFPYILLNLILSCIAAIQAPIIMMSQNRQQQRDRIKQYQDYKSELKVRS